MTRERLDTLFASRQHRVLRAGGTLIAISQFAFLKPEWPDFKEAAARAETLAFSDPRGSAFARRALEADHANLDAELRRLREEVAAARAVNEARPDTHDYGEAATRDKHIDFHLREAGWDPEAPGVAEHAVSGMPGGTGKGFVDYVLWGDDGRPLALVEAKATRHDPRGQPQAKLYVDCLEAAHGQRPVIFLSNGYLRESGVGTPEDIERAKAAGEGLGLFVRSLVGMEGAAAKEAFAGFLTGRSLTGNQMELVGMIVDHLTENGAMDAARLYKSPYTNLNPLGVEGVFPEDSAVDEVISILDEVRRRAAA